MKKARPFLIILAILGIGLIIAFQIRIHSGAVTVSKKVILNNASIQQWYIDSTKDTRAHVIIKVTGGKVNNKNTGSIIIKGKANATNKTIDAKTIEEKGSVAFALPFYKGDGNYIQLVGCDVSNVGLEIEVTSHTWETCFTDNHIENGTDYGLK